MANNKKMDFVVHVMGAFIVQASSENEAVKLAREKMQAFDPDACDQLLGSVILDRIENADCPSTIKRSV